MKRIFNISLAFILCSTLCLSQKTIRVPQDSATIQSAINGAVNGDTVLVAEGTYLVNLLISKKIVLGSLYLVDRDTSHISRTILDGGSPQYTDSASVIRITVGTDSTTVIMGFTIQNGHGTINVDPYDAHNWIGGGGIWIDAGGATISHNVIKNNSMSSSTRGVYGGGIAMSPLLGSLKYWVIDSNQIMNNQLTCTVPAAIGAEGGGAWLTEDGRFTNNTVAGNTVSGTVYSVGGGIDVMGSWLQGSSNILFSGNAVRNNTAWRAGGLYAAVGVTPTDRPNCTLVNNIITGNTSSGGGSAITIESGDYVLINNTIAGNGGSYAVRLYVNRGALSFRMLNNIVWNTGATQEFFNVGYATGSYNCVRQGFTGVGNISSDPMFVSGDSLYRLGASSPCVDAGAMSATVGIALTAPVKDYLGNVRPKPIGSKPDMGAIESDAGIAVRRVPQDFARIQDAINASAEKDIVLVAEGTYTENLIINKKVTLASLYFQDDSTSHISKTILDGGSPGNADSASVIGLLAGTDTNTVITGFTIQNGKGTKWGSLGTWVGVYGGGIVGIAGGATITHNIIKNNQCISSTVGVGAGGIDLLPSSDRTIKPSPWFIAHNTIENNTSISTAASTAGWAEAGGVDLGGNGKFINNVVKNNSVSGSYYGYGGGVYVYSIAGETDIQISNNLIIANQASSRGGGIFSVMTPGYNLRVTCSNNIIAANSATNGSAISINGGDYEAVNNTVTGNIGTRAIYPISGTGPLAFRLLNNILWNPGTSSEFYSLTGVSASYNCVRGGITGTGNIDTDPLFNQSDTLYSLLSTSPCISKGVLSATVGGVPLQAPIKDYLGLVRPRPNNSLPDLGAIEHDSGIVVGVKELFSDQLPTSYGLEQNYPNPFNPTTNFQFSIANFQFVTLKVYDLLGREVTVLVNEKKPAGRYEVKWDASKMASGVYFYKLTAGNFVQTRRMLLLK